MSEKYPYLITRQRDGLVRYFFNNGGKPRKDIPLGGDYTVAVTKWKALIKKRPGYAKQKDPKEAPLVASVADIVPVQAVVVGKIKRAHIDVLPKYYINFQPKVDITPFNLKEWNQGRVSILNPKHPLYSR